MFHIHELVEKHGFNIQVCRSIFTHQPFKVLRLVSSRKRKKTNFQYVCQFADGREFIADDGAYDDCYLANDPPINEILLRLAEKGLTMKFDKEKNRFFSET